MTRRRRPPHRRQRLPAWSAWLLALVLLHAQALGLWHGIAHGAAAGSAVAQADAQAAGEHRDVFGHSAADQGQCRLYDALGSAAGPWSAPCLQAAALPAAAPAPAAAPSKVGRSARPYEARAPPRA
ncbi:MAG: hypothetical protein QM750_03665 [Rubrivivax sp.]